MSIYEYDEEKHIRQERQESYTEGTKDGAVLMLYKLVEENLLSLKTAAEKAGMSEQVFREQMTAYLSGNQRNFV